MQGPDLTQFPTGHYGALYADPPWRTLTWSNKGRSRCPEGRYYDTMSFEELCDLGQLIRPLRQPNCRLFLWTIDSHLPQAFALAQSWGFKYSTVAFVWNKTTSRGKPAFGPGHATRKGAEICLLFLRGRLQRQSRSVRQVITAPIREHSRKPDETRDRITELVPGPYLELFARQSCPGWDSFGNQLNRKGPKAGPKPGD